jgi:hypothetical protein
MTDARGERRAVGVARVTRACVRRARVIVDARQERSTAKSRGGRRSAGEGRSVSSGRRVNCGRLDVGMDDARVTRGRDSRHIQHAHRCFRVCNDRSGRIPAAAPPRRRRVPRGSSGAPMRRTLRGAWRK